jgi:hypothetical protein
MLREPLADRVTCANAGTGGSSRNSWHPGLAPVVGEAYGYHYI